MYAPCGRSNLPLSPAPCRSLSIFIRLPVVLSKFLLQYRGACPASRSDTELLELVKKMGGDEAKIQSALEDWWQSESTTRSPRPKNRPNHDLFCLLAPTKTLPRALAVRKAVELYD